MIRPFSLVILFVAIFAFVSSSTFGVYRPNKTRQVKRYPRYYSQYQAPKYHRPKIHWSHRLESSSPQSYWYSDSWDTYDRDEIDRGPTYPTRPYQEFGGGADRNSGDNISGGTGGPDSGGGGVGNDPIF